MAVLHIPRIISDSGATYLPAIQSPTGADFQVQRCSGPAKGRDAARGSLIRIYDYDISWTGCLGPVL